jgi:hypothetical protein
METEQEKPFMYDEESAQFVEDEFKRRQQERIPFELQWRLNMEFIKGNQFLVINNQLRKLDEVPKQFWYQEREVFNQISTIVETRISKISRQKPLMKTRPATNELNDISSAKVSNALLISKWHDERMGTKYEDLTSWLEYTGTGIIKTLWDPNSGRMIGQTEEGLIREGDTETVIVSPFEIYPDNNHRSGVEECKSVIHARAYDINEIFDTYGIKVDEEDIESITMQNANGGFGVGYMSGGFRSKTIKLKGHALVKEFWERPSKRHPEGRLIVVAGGKTLYSGGLPYQIGEDQTPDLPFIVMPCIKIPNQFWGASVTERCIPIQRRYNALKNRKAEYLNRVAIGQWYEPIDSIDDDTELNNEPGSRIRYQPGLPRPEPVQYPSLPNSFEMEEQSLLNSFTSVSGVSELSRYSEAPTGVKSGVALSIANEQDDTRISMTTSRLAEGMIQTAKYWLRLYKQFADEPRMLRNVGESNEFHLQYWTASDLKSEDIIVENSSALSETPAQRRQMVFDLAGLGLFNRPESNPYSPEGVRKILEMLELGHWENGIDSEETLQTNYAQREQAYMLKGQPVPINDFDIHEIHVREHNHLRMTPEYLKMLSTPVGPMIDQMLRQHIDQHRLIIEQQQMAMIQQQLAAGGMEQHE